MLGVTFLTIGLLGSFLQYQWHNKEIHFTQEVLAQEPEEIIVEVVIDWTPARIEKQIRETFPEDPDTAVAIAKCESGLNPNAVGPTDDHGIFQLHAPSHDLSGIDVYDPEQNIAFARKLYEESGWNPWYCYTLGMI